ncbi:MAG: HNH endonuclease [Nitrospirae bacterium]|nr:MAG: HNH endonuclease [Nitrospirota bacterium]
MARNPSTTTRGGSFDQLTIEAVWRKARAVAGYDSNQWRVDQCGVWINRAAYGTVSQYGWEIDHAFPVSRGGTDDLANLQPLHWQNNRGKGDDYPRWTCTISSKV